MKTFETLISKYNSQISDENLTSLVQKIISKNFDKFNKKEIYKTCLSLIDLTTLNVDDTKEKVENLVKKINDFNKNFPQLENVAAICVYPSLVKTVKENLRENVGIAAVSAGFPASQTFLEVKIAETALCLISGATEIDVVLSVSKFLEGNFQEVFDEIVEIKSTCKDKKLKVILETGALKTVENIEKASLLAMAAGADFIKTSTGKISVSATLEATLVMCNAIKFFAAETGKIVGYKPAGGIVSTKDAVEHFTIVSQILGNQWLNKNYFRFGASRLANNLLSDILEKEVSYF